MRLGEQLTEVGRSVVATLLAESEHFAKLVRKDWKLRTANESAVAERVAKEVWGVTKAAANAARFERELDEKYGPFKDIILNPTAQWVLAVAASAWRDFHAFGKRPLPPVGAVMVLIMMVRAHQTLPRILLAVAILSGMHPLLMALGATLYLRAVSAPRKPRGYTLFIPAEPREKAGEPLEDAFHPSKLEPDGYDFIVVGSTIGGLVVAALLSRVGKRVLVLESSPRIGGSALVNAGDYEFETASPAVGAVRRYARILAAAAGPAAPQLRWFPVGVSAGGSAKVHRVVRVGARGGVVLHPAGRGRLLEHLSAGHPEERERVETFLSSLAVIGGAAAADLLERIFPAKTASRLRRVTGDGYAAFARKPIAAVLERVTDSAPLRSALISLFAEENLAHEEVASGAYVRAVVPALDGVHYPRGGWRAVAASLLPAIEATGGRVLTHAGVKHALLEGGRVAGVVLRDLTAPRSSGGVEVRLRGSGGAVISALGAIETFEALVTDADADAVGGRFPAGFGELRGARPRLHACVGLTGNWSDALDATAADYVHARDDGAARRDERYQDADSEWLRIAFPGAKDPDRWWAPRTACVVSCELADDVLREESLPGGVFTPGAAASAAADAKGRKGEAPPLELCSAPRVWALKSGAGLDRARDRLVRRLHDVYPATRGVDEVVHAVVEARPGVSAACAASEALRCPTHIPGLLLASADMCGGGFGGGVDAAWAAAHAALGYTPMEMLLLKRTLVRDLSTLR